MTLMYSSQLDAGGSRFFGDFDLTKSFQVNLHTNPWRRWVKVSIQMNCDYYPDLFQKKELTCHTSLTIDHMFWFSVWWT